MDGAVRAEQAPRFRLLDRRGSLPGFTHVAGGRRAGRAESLETGRARGPVQGGNGEVCPGPRGRRGREAGWNDEVLHAIPLSGASAASDAGRRTERLMARLTPVQRAAVTLYYFEDRAVERVAEALGLPENTVKTHLFRARAALREAWASEEGVPDELRRV